MDLNSLLLQVREKFSPRKKVDFNEEGLHFEIEPLTSLEEAKVLTTLKDVEDTQYVSVLKRHTLACSIKKINDIDLSGESVEYVEGEEKKKKSKYLYMVDFLGKWPSSLIDVLFDAFSDMNRQAEAKARKDAQFEKFVVSEEVPADAPGKFRPLDEAVPVEELSPEERLEKKVEREIEEADLHMAEAEAKAEEPA